MSSISTTTNSFPVDLNTNFAIAKTENYKALIQALFIHDDVSLVRLAVNKIMRTQVEPLMQAIANTALLKHPDKGIRTLAYENLANLHKQRQVDTFLALFCSYQHELNLDLQQKLRTLLISIDEQKYYNLGALNEKQQSATPYARIQNFTIFDKDLGLTEEQFTALLLGTKDANRQVSEQALTNLYDYFPKLTVQQRNLLLLQCVHGLRNYVPASSDPMQLCSFLRLVLKYPEYGNLFEPLVLMQTENEHGFLQLSALCTALFLDGCNENAIVASAIKFWKQNSSATTQAKFFVPNEIEKSRIENLAIVEAEVLWQNYGISEFFRQQCGIDLDQTELYELVQRNEGILTNFKNTLDEITDQYVVSIQALEDRVNKQIAVYSRASVISLAEIFFLKINEPNRRKIVACMCELIMSSNEETLVKEKALKQIVKSGLSNNELLPLLLKIAVTDRGASYNKIKEIAYTSAANLPNLSEQNMKLLCYVLTQFGLKEQCPSCFNIAKQSLGHLQNEKIALS